MFERLYKNGMFTVVVTCYFYLLLFLTMFYDFCCPGLAQVFLIALHLSFLCPFSSFAKLPLVGLHHNPAFISCISYPIHFILICWIIISLNGIFVFTYYFSLTCSILCLLSLNISCTLHYCWSGNLPATFVY